MKIFLLLILVISPSLLFAQVSVQYKVYHSTDIVKNGLKVELNYKTKKKQDSIYFHYYNEGWGETNLFNCLELLESENPNLKFIRIPDSNRIIVYYPKSKSIKLTYHIRQDFTGDSLSVFNRPRMNQDYFHILGRELFVVPEDVFTENNKEIEVKINWIDFPENYVIHNTFGSQKKMQVIKSPIHEGLYHSLFVGGDYRLYNFSCKNKPVVFAIRGEWYADYSNDKKLLEALQKTVTVQRDFWNDYQKEYYTVIMTPTVSQNDSLYPGQSCNGSALKNGFMIQSSNNVFNQFEILNYMFNHEMMHDWIGLTIVNKHEELNYWFSEGFTDYYTYKNRLRSADITLEEWRKSFNRDLIQAHYANPERNKPNYVIVDDFWKSRDVEKIPYRRGALFAFWLDNKIMKTSDYTKSLDDLMRVLLVKCTLEERMLTDEFFLEEARKFLNDEDISYEFQKYILNGDDIPFTNDDLIDCFEVETLENVPQIQLKISEHKYILTN